MLTFAIRVIHYQITDGSNLNVDWLSYLKLQYNSQLIFSYLYFFLQITIYYSALYFTSSNGRSLNVLGQLCI